ncbi:YggS family pyridoxal phosphate-dependent enzyme [Urechidicola croceus]|uniref:Pyridoxal phosphate homeostasis protein n=1 Tax=Urechidicola croceus TaxID=1850246 RepID=A0A1D8P574_9FLAO|nr:YggS family pyridoxal phosphate-dependent enzyme [Urechidicola croceus]AOW19671.1 YggS family pyridoxal phosphate enzyme [Urechidicola croceus]
MNIAENLQKIKLNLPENVSLVAVSKTKPVSDILDAYNAGQRIFGENKIQEMVEKHHQLPKDIQWHMIGHLQSNKVKYMAHFVDLIHGVDSFKTLKEINKQAKKHNRIINCLLQVKIATEETKFGLIQKEVEEIITSEEYNQLKNINVIGFMGMASFTSDINQITKEFKSLKTFFDHIKSNNSNIKVLSMGMSGDYTTAINEGSNMIRVGSAIFGTR